MNGAAFKDNLGNRPKPYVPSRRPTASRYIGLLTIPLATVTALCLVPSDISTPGALMWPAWVLTIGLLASPVLDTIAHGFARLLRAEHVLMAAFLVVVYPELLQPFYATRLDGVFVQKTLIAIGLFATTLVLGSSLRPWPLPRGIVDLADRQYPAKMIFKVAVLCWALAMLNYAYASDFSLTNIVNGLFADRWSAPWARGYLGGWDAFRDFLNNFGFLLPTFTVLLALRAGWRNPMTVVALLCSAMNLAFIAQSGGRRLVVFVVGAALLAWICAKRRQLGPKQWVIVGLLVTGTVMGLDIVLAARNTGIRDFSYTGSEFGELHVDDNFRSLGETLRVIPAEAEFVGFHELWYVAVRPIPRIFWAGKPTGPGFDLAEHLGDKGESLSITVIGELYMSFGWIGIAVGGLVLGSLARSWSLLLERIGGAVGTALYGLGTMALFIGVRSLQELVMLSYPILCWYVVDLVLWKFPRRGRARRRPVAWRTACG
jgi:hypothetical protein